MPDNLTAAELREQFVDAITARRRECEDIIQILNQAGVPRGNINDQQPWDVRLKWLIDERDEATNLAIDLRERLDAVCRVGPGYTAEQCIADLQKQIRDTGEKARKERDAAVAECEKLRNRVKALETELDNQAQNAADLSTAIYNLAPGRGIGLTSVDAAIDAIQDRVRALEDRLRRARAEVALILPHGSEHRGIKNEALAILAEGDEKGGS